MNTISLFVICLMACNSVTCWEEMLESALSVWCYDCDSKITPVCTAAWGQRLKMCDLPYCIADVQGEDANATIVRRCASEKEAQRYANTLPPYNSDRGMSEVACEKVKEMSKSIRRCVCVSNGCTWESMEMLLNKNLTTLNWLG